MILGSDSRLARVSLAVPHLSPILWDRTKLTHITLSVIGFFLLGPAILVLFAFWQSMESGPSFTYGSTETLLITSAMIGACSGILAWTFLCLLFFKRYHLRWQMASWSVCAGFGYLTMPCIIGWILWFSCQGPISESVVLLVLLGIFFAALFSMVSGHRNAAAALRLLRQIRKQS